LLHRWRDEAVRAGRPITRIALAFEAGRDGFWLARWLAVRGIEAHVIHASSVAVSREHRRAKTDRLDTELLKRGFLGWLRGEQNGPAARSFAADAHDGIMVRIKQSYRIQFESRLLPAASLLRTPSEPKKTCRGL